MQIPLSTIKGADFDKAVRDYRDACEAHLNTVNKPAPRAPYPLVEQVVIRERTGPDTPDRFVIAPYEIIDDTPVSPEVQLLRDSIKN